jgi:hypothetical protein
MSVLPASAAKLRAPRPQLLLLLLLLLSPPLLLCCGNVLCLAAGAETPACVAQAAAVATACGAATTAAAQLLLQLPVCPTRLASRRWQLVLSMLAAARGVWHTDGRCGSRAGGCAALELSRSRVC